MSRADRLRRLRKAKDAEMARAEPRLIPARGQVVAVRRNAQRQITFVDVSQGGGVVIRGIPANGLVGLAQGAIVDLLGRGKAGSSILWRIDRVVESAEGAGSTDPRALLSTPAIADIDFMVGVTGSGEVRVHPQITVLLVEEQWRRRQQVYYQIQIRDEDGTVVGDVNSAVLERVAGRLAGALSVGHIGNVTINRDTGRDAPSFAFPPRGVAGADAELFYYAVTSSPATNSITIGQLMRAFAGTTAASHTANTWATLRGITIAGTGLNPNTPYELRARAVNASDGGTSNWTDWEAFVTDFDTTPPGWADDDPGLTVTESAGGFAVTWQAADENATDLSHYELGISVDGATWETVRVGNGTTYVHPAAPGQVRHFRVRAHDFSGNFSAWSSSVRAGLSIPRPPSSSENVVVNGSFPTNAANWTATDDAAGGLSRNSTRGLRGLGCLQIDLIRNVGIASAKQALSGLTVGDKLIARAHVQKGTNFVNGNDFVTLGIGGGRSITVAATVLPGAGGVWLALEATFTATATTADVALYFEHALLPTGQVAIVYVDDIEVYKVGR